MDQPTDGRPPGWGEPGYQSPATPPPIGPPTKRSHRLWILGAAGTSALLLLVAIVVVADRMGGSDKLATATQPTTAAATTLPETTPATDAPANTEPATPLAFGDTQIYEDGTEVTVVVGKRRPISDVAAGGSRARDDLLPVTVKIKAGRTAIDLAPDVSLQYGTGGKLAADVFDQGIDAMQAAPSVLRPHKAITGAFGFAVPKGSATAVTVTVTPTYDHAEATFEGMA